MKKPLNTKSWQMDEYISIALNGVKSVSGLTKEEEEDCIKNLDPYPYANYAQRDKGLHISDGEWLELESFFSKPLSSDDRLELLNFIGIAMIYNESDTNNPEPTIAQLKQELTKFKETSQKLINEKEFEEVPTRVRFELTSDTEETMQNACEALSSTADSLICKAIWFMCRSEPLRISNSGLHPSQYYCAAIIALEQLPKVRKGNITKDETGFYRALIDLWTSLGGTDLEVTYNQEYDVPQISKFLGFTYITFKIISKLTNTDIKKIDTIRKDLAKYKKLIDV